MGEQTRVLILTGSSRPGKTTSRSAGVYLAEALAALDGPAVAAGLFAEDGLHAGRDVTEFIAEARADVPYLGAIGADPGVADLIVDQVAAFDAARGL